VNTADLRRSGIRALCALAAVAIAAVTGGLAAPGRADAGPPPGKLCTIDELKNPANLLDCTRRAAAAVGATVTCTKAPAPVSPDAGLVGIFTIRPDASVRTVSGTYGWGFTRSYGAAGYQLPMYDTGCLGTVRHPGSTFQNDIASKMFQVSAAAISGTGVMRDYAFNPKLTWGWSDGPVDDITGGLYDHLFKAIGTLAFAAVGVLLLWRARDADLPDALKIAGWALIAMVIASLVGASPSRTAHVADTVVGGGLRVTQQIVGPQKTHLSPEMCQAITFTPGKGACEDRLTPSERVTDDAIYQLLYRNWCRAVFGSADSETVKRYGRPMFDSLVYTWDEQDKIAAAEAAGDTQMRVVIDTRKAEQWNTAAAVIAKTDPTAYRNLQGLNGFDRLISGVMTMGESLMFCLFDLISSAVIIFGFGVFRIAVIVSPALGAIAIYRPTSKGLRRIADMVITNVIRMFTFGLIAAVYQRFVDFLVNSAAIPDLLRVSILGFVGATLVVSASMLIMRSWRRHRHARREWRDTELARGNPRQWFGANAGALTQRVTNALNIPDGAPPGSSRVPPGQRRARPEAHAAASTAATATAAGSTSSTGSASPASGAARSPAGARRAAPRPAGAAAHTAATRSRPEAATAAPSRPSLPARPSQPGAPRPGAPRFRPAGTATAPSAPAQPRSSRPETNPGGPK
jgi:hypothetical protein